MKAVKTDLLAGRKHQYVESAWKCRNAGLSQREDNQKLRLP
jgi:hypothetical protein